MHRTFARWPARTCGARRRPTRWTGFLLLVIAVVVGFGLSSSRAFAADAPTGISPVVFTTNAADAAQMATYCGGPSAAGNLVLVFVVRGSGEDYLAGKFIKYNPKTKGPTNVLLQQYFYPRLDKALMAKGYRVWIQEGQYPALSAASTLGYGLLGHGLIPDFIKSAWDYGPSLAAQLGTSIAHCPGRRVVIAGYSQGGIAIRSMLHVLAAKHPSYLASIAHIDLIADGSANSTLDAGMPRGGISGVDPRRATNAIWTVAGRLKPLLKILHFPGVKAFPKELVSYPTSLRHLTYQYCLVDDGICDTAGMIKQVARDVALCTAVPGG